MESGRTETELKMIENRINRQVTFAKRRNGLLKKAYELSVLCDAEIGLIIFSQRGRLYEYSSNSCMTDTLERYKRVSLCEEKPAKGILQEEPPKNNPAIECSHTEPHVIVSLSQRIMSMAMKENLAMAPKADLEKLESQIDSFLKHIRDIKEKDVRDVSGTLSLLALEEGQGSGMELEPNSSYARL